MALVAKNMRVELGGNTIVHNMNLTVEPGEFVGVLGPSGSGKSTMVLALTGLRPATAGAVSLDGAPLYEKYDELKSSIGFVPQDDIVPTALRVERVLQYAADLRLPDLDPEARQQRVKEVMRMLDLTERARLRVSRLSGGQRKRVSVGVELLSRPTVLFADEPTSGLDPALERKLMQAMRDLARDERRVIVTTHVLNSLDLLDRVCVLAAGRRVFWGPVALLKEFFEIEDVAQMYTRLTEKTPDAWASAFDAFARTQNLSP